MWFLCVTWLSLLFLRNEFGILFFAPLSSLPPKGWINLFLPPSLLLPVFFSLGLIGKHFPQGGFKAPSPDPTQGKPRPHKQKPHPKLVIQNHHKFKNTMREKNHFRIHVLVKFPPFFCRRGKVKLSSFFPRLWLWWKVKRKKSWCPNTSVGKKKGENEGKGILTFSSFFLGRGGYMLYRLDMTNGRKKS